MKRIASILVVALFVAGCDWFEPKARVIQPDEEYAVENPATRPAKSGDTDSRPVPETGPAKAAGSTKPDPPERPITTTRSSAQYRIIGKSEIVSAKMLQVNDRFITLDKVLRPVRRKLTEAAAGVGEKVFRIKAMEIISSEIRRQIKHTLLLAEADNRLTDAHKKLVDEKVAERLRQNIAEMGGSKAKLDKHLRSEGTDLATWREDLRQALLIRSYMHDRVGKRIIINRRTMWEYYVSHRLEFCKSDSVRMQIIYVPSADFLPKDRRPTEADRRAARSKAKARVTEAAAALARSEEFDKVAKKFSAGPMAQNGGVWSMMERGSFRAEAVEETAFAQGAGKTSKVIETPNGFYIVKTLAVQRGEQAPFEKVQDIITEKLRRRQFEKLTYEYQMKLYSKVTIVEADQFVRRAVDAAVQKFYKRS